MKLYFDVKTSLPLTDTKELFDLIKEKIYRKILKEIIFWIISSDLLSLFFETFFYLKRNEIFTFDLSVF
jgi:hypothetical protein